VTWIYVPRRRQIVAPGGTPSDLLLKFEAVDGSTTFTDTSGNSRTVTAQGNAQVDTAQFKYGAASMLLDGSGDYAIATLPSFNYAANSFYVAAWVRWNSAPSNSGIFSWGTGEPYYVHLVAGGLYVGDGSNNIMNPAWAPSANTWYHISLSHTYTAPGNESWRLRVDGGATISVNSLASLNQTSQTAFNIGSRPSQGSYVDGWMDDVVVVHGDPVYTGASFTPSEWT
jgi:hypothetical protein